MTKTKLAFVRCRLSCFSRRPVRFFPVFSLLPVCCCSPVVVFAVRHWGLPAFSRGGFFAIVFLFFYRLFPPAVRFAFFPVFSLLPVCCCSPVVVFAVRHWGLPAFSRGGFFAIVFLFFYRLFLPAVRFAFFPVFSLLPVFPFLVCLFLRRFLYLVFLFCFSLLFFLRFVFSFLQGSDKWS